MFHLIYSFRVLKCRRLDHDKRTIGLGLGAAGFDQNKKLPGRAPFADIVGMPVVFHRITGDIPTTNSGLN